MGEECSKYIINYPIYGVILFELFGIFIYIISTLENRNSSNRNCVLIYFIIQTSRPLSLERMQQDDGWALLRLDLDVCNNQCRFPYAFPEKYLSQNRIIQSGNYGPRQRACNVSELHVVSQSSASLLQIHRTVQRKAHIREVRNRTVSECCEGYVQLYTECVPKCVDCNNFQCNSTSKQCTCLPGFVGSRCNETCEDGKWGEKCSEVCTCRIGEACDKVTGLCTLKPTDDLSTSAPVIQFSENSTTTTDFIHLLAFQPSSTYAEPTTAGMTTTLERSQPTLPTPSITTSFSIQPPTSHNTPFPTTIVENKSSIPPSTVFFNSRITTNMPLPSDILNTLQTIVKNNSTLNNESEKQNNLTTIESDYSITLNIKPKLTELMSKELPSSTTFKSIQITSTEIPPLIEIKPKELPPTTFGPSEIVANYKPKNPETEPKEQMPTFEFKEEISTNKPQVKETKSNELLAMLESREIISTTTQPMIITTSKELTPVFESSEIISTINSLQSEPMRNVLSSLTMQPWETVSNNVTQVTNKKLLSSTSETIATSLNIPLENYSKDVNVSLPSSVVPFSEFNLNATIMFSPWFNELSANSSVTLIAALVLVVLVVVTTSIIVHCCSHKKSSEIPDGKQIQQENGLNLISRNGHYDVPGPPTFSFINAYALELLTKDICEANYDYPCSARCLVVNEPVYDELRY